MTRKNLNRISGERLFKNKESGFSLVELMVAIAVLGVGLLAIASMQLGSVNANANARDVSEAAVLAEQQMEHLMSLPYRFNLANDNQNPVDLQDTTGNGTAGLMDPFPDARPIYDPSDLAAWMGANPPDHQRNEVTEKRNYTIFWNIATDAEINNTKTVQIIVTWAGEDIARKLILRRVIPRIS